MTVKKGVKTKNHFLLLFLISSQEDTSKGAYFLSLKSVHQGASFKLSNILLLLTALEKNGENCEKGKKMFTLRAVNLDIFFETVH